MRRRSIVATLLLILALALPVAVAAEDPPAPVARYTFRVPGLPAPGPMEVVQFLFEYPPGAATPAHTHPGLTFGFVLEGEVTFERGGQTTLNKSGDVILERPGEVGVARNATSASARSIVSLVIPQGAAPSTPQPGAAVPPVTPVARYLYRTPAAIPAGQYEVVQQVLDFAPGAQTPVHTHPGQVVVTVLEGALTFTVRGTTTVYQAGESFIEQPGVAAQARNAGSTRATVMATYLLPQGAPLSSPVATPAPSPSTAPTATPARPAPSAPPAPPSTGSGGNLPGMPNTGAGGGAGGRLLGWLALVVGGGLAAGGGLLKRRARRG